jgi:RHS repeat-associated protein
MDSAGAIVKQVDYDSFGSIINDSNAGIIVPFGFAGGLHDRDTGLVRFGYRDYDPAIGTFISKDPIGITGGINLYSYVGNNPIRRIDPFGLKAGDWWDLPANYNRAEAIAREELAIHQGHNNSDDAMRHAEWSQRMTDELGGGYAWLFGTGHEITGTLQGQPLDEMLMDLHDNSIGRQAGRDNLPIDTDNLWTLPLKDPRYDNNYPKGCSQ